MSDNHFVSLKTKNCIVTGEPATCFTGWVEARCSGGISDDYRMAILNIGIVAGFKDMETLKAANHLSNDKGCYGPWKRSYGVQGND